MTFDFGEEFVGDRVVSRRFDEAVHDLGRHEYLWYNALANDAHGELLHMPALPPRPRSPYEQIPA